MTTRTDVLVALTTMGVEGDVAGEILDQFVRHYAAVAQHNLLAETVGLPKHPDSHPKREKIALALAAHLGSGSREEE